MKGATLILLAAAGCTVFPAPDPGDVDYFTIDVGTFKPVEAPRNARLYVRPFTAPEIYSYPIVLRPEPYKLVLLEDHRWVEPPADLAAEAMERVVIFSGLFRPTEDAPEWEMQGRVLRFDLVQEGDRKIAHAALHLEIVDSAGGHIWSGRFSEQVAVQDNPGRAMSKALRSIGEQFIASLLQADLR